MIYVFTLPAHLRMARLLWEERREEFDDRAEERRKVDEQSRTGDARIERGSALRRAGFAQR